MLGYGRGRWAVAQVLILIPYQYQNNYRWQGYSLLLILNDYFRAGCIQSICVFAILKMHVSPISHLQLHQKKEKKIRPKVHPLLYHTFYNCCNSGKMASMFWGGKLFYQNCWEFFFSHSFHLYFHYFIRSVVFEIAPCDSMSLITVLATIKIILESDSIFLLCSISLN